MASTPLIINLTNKITVLLLVLFVINNYVNADFETDLKYIQICNQTSPITMRMMNEVLINKKLPTNLDALGNFKCFLHCLFKYYGWMDTIGGFEINKIHHDLVETGSISSRAMKHIMWGCTALEEMNKCERAFLFIQCFWEKSQENSEDDKFLYSFDEQDPNMLIR